MEYTFRPNSAQKHWRNQFYVIDALKHFSKIVEDGDLVLILDSDIIWSGHLNTRRFWKELDETGFLSMCPIMDSLENINGFTVAELKTFAKEIGYNDIDLTSYSGGEFIALRGDILKEIQIISNDVWIKYNEILEGTPHKFIEEAHLLTIAYSLNNLTPGLGDKYIRRIWTQLCHYQNRSNLDLDLVLWHLPAEKSFGLRRLANEYLSTPIEKILENYDMETKHRIEKLGVSRNGLKKSILDFSYSISQRIRKKLNFVKLQ